MSSISTLEKKRGNEEGGRQKKELGTEARRREERRERSRRKRRGKRRRSGESLVTESLSGSGLVNAAWFCTPCASYKEDGLPPPSRDALMD